jgi:hypothetical protein
MEKEEKKMEVRVYDPDAEGKSISFDEFIERMDAEDAKKNFRNWFNKLFPNGFGGYNSYYILLHPWEFFDECFRQVKWAWQRVFRGWDDRVVWSIDQYIARMLPQWLSQLKEVRHGVPNIMFKEEDYIDENYNVTEETMKLRGQDFDNVLDQISEGFRIYAENNWFREGSEEEKKFDESFELLQKYFGTLWD